MSVSAILLAAGAGTRMPPLLGVSNSSAPKAFMQRAMARMPKQGDRAPWVNPQVYKAEKHDLLKAPLDDGVLQFTRTNQRITV